MHENKVAGLIWRKLALLKSKLKDTIFLAIITFIVNGLNPGVSVVRIV